MVEFDEGNDVTTATAALTVEQVFVGVNEKAGLMVGVQRTKPQEAAEADGPGLLPIVSLQILQQRNLLFQFIERSSSHGLLASIRRIRQGAPENPGREGGGREKVQAGASGLSPAAEAEQSTACPPAQGRGIRQTGGIFTVRRGLLNGFAGGNPLTRLLSTAQSVLPRRCEPLGQDRKGLPARLTDSTSHSDRFTLIVMSVAESLSVTDDGVLPADGTLPRQEGQRDHPGSMLSFDSGSAIKRITAGVKGAADRRCQVST